ncbi:MAG: hypothetical protein A3I66_20060 [Burkholderiales bacterium RIFCSPLOWO2_02_FULL_57_36]|nr:MAG: hypothetical protein A3I66_20060 [Burkholderiales bacterium RIFCSPLOWO2_02_FULL_57_36]
MGRRHILAAKNVGFEIAGIYDPSPDAITLALDEQNLPRSIVFSSAEQMLTTVKPDAIVVSSTAPSHGEYVCLAADVGVKYILCEKPMAVSIAECDRMMEACKRAGAILAINHQMRFLEQYTAVKELADSAAFGGLRSMTVCASNFGLSMNGSHYFEAFRFLTGEEILSVSFWADAAVLPNPRGPEYTDRSGQLRAVTPSGVRLYGELSADQGHGIQVIYGCRYGQILVDELSGFMRIMHRQEQYRDLPTTRYGMPAVEVIRQIEPVDVVGPTESLWKAMLKGGSIPDGQCGRHAVATLVAANLSGEQDGRAVQIDAGLPVARVFPWA